MLAVIGGTNLTQWPALRIEHREVVRTPYGDPSSALYFGEVSGRDAVFLARHGFGQTIAAHRINYRANLWALKSRGVRTVVALSSVGSIDGHVPGELVLPHQLIDYTKGDVDTFFDNGSGVVHIDFAQPYTPALRKAVLRSAAAAEIAVSDGGVYAAISGPRLETAAEIDRFARDGATLVGMSGMPEPALARELRLPYAVLALVTGYAAGRNRGNMDRNALSETFEAGLQNMLKLLDRIVAQSLPEDAVS